MSRDVHNGPTDENQARGTAYSGDPAGGEGAEQTALSTLALDRWHRSKGARMVPFAGYEMPVQYEGVIAEHLWTRAHAGLFDVSHMGQLLFYGDQVDRALETLLPGALQELKDGRLRYSMLLDESGGIIDDLMATRRDDHFYVVVNGATKHGDIEHLEARLPRTIVVDHMKEQALLALQGPRAAEALARLVPDVADLTFMTGGAFQLAGITAWISRSGYTGEDGFEISVPSAAVVEIADLLLGQPEVKPIGLGARDSLRLEAGLPLYGHDLDLTTTPVEAVADALAAHEAVKPIGLGARDSLRLEAGLPLYGHDLDTGTTPVMADLQFAIQKRRRAEGGFAGDLRILAELEKGPMQKRVGLNVEGRQPVREGALILDSEGEQVGRITSGTFSPSLQRPIAMGYVATALSAPGSKLTLEQRGKLFQAEVTPMPFVPHRYHRKPGA